MAQASASPFSSLEDAPKPHATRALEVKITFFGAHDEGNVTGGGGYGYVTNESGKDAATGVLSFTTPTLWDLAIRQAYLPA